MRESECGVRCDVCGSERRLMSRGRLSGALHTLGYYSTDVCLGSPPRRYDLILDTGSSITAVPCSTCTSCGEHVCGRSGRFSTTYSKTAQVCGRGWCLQV